jgi:hypothetical protein
MSGVGHRVDGNPAVYGDRNEDFNESDYSIKADLQKKVDSISSWDQQLNGQQLNDTNLNAAMQIGGIDRDTPLRVGRVILAYPYIHCYKLQLSGRQGTTIATALSRGSHSPIGVQSSDVIPTNSNVLVWYPKGATLAYIIAVIPSPTTDDAFNPSDFIQAGGNSGVKKVEAYRNIPKAAALGHGWVPQSCGRPMDGLNGEYVRMSETGIGLLIDSFQTYLRVNEACGLWLNYFDSHAKLSALSLHIMSYCEHIFQQNDEGELFALKGYATYPWEAAGMYSFGTEGSKTNPEEQVQLDKEFPFASEDLKDFAQVPVYRMTDYTGYLGQGFNRTIIKPAKQSGPRLMTDTDKDTGLFQQLMALDGAYSVKSAKQITIAKYPLIPNPRRVRQVEDALGDDLENQNDYKFSGQFGEGQEHKVRDWEDAAVSDFPNLVRPSGILDLLTHHFNWKSTHPFQYHTKDYVYPEEGETNSALNSVKFYRGSMNSAYVTVYPVTLRIDDRFQDVNYYDTASLISLTEDGSIVLADGYGSQILLTGGQIRLEAGGDVMLMSGSRVVTLANEAIVRAKNNIDISSSDRDVRIKAENNMQLLAGNSGIGGMLIESRSQGIAQQYENRVGDEVQATGITFLAKNGGLNLLSLSTYIRTGINDEAVDDSNGQLIIDCANGKSSFNCYALGHYFFNSEGLGIWHRPKGNNDIVIDQSHFFGPNFSKVHGPTVFDELTVVFGFFGASKSIYSKEGIFALGRMACQKGISGIGNSEDNDFSSKVIKFFDEIYQQIPETNSSGSKIFDGVYKNYIWKGENPGNETLLKDHLGFSYRDKSDFDNTAYGYDANQFFLLEPRWQQLSRMGLVTSQSEDWKENPVFYQGVELYPWPGKVNWVSNPTLLGYSNSDQFFLFDQTKARSRKDNQSSYEEPIFEDWKKSVCDSTYRL